MIPRRAFWAAPAAVAAGLLLGFYARFVEPRRLQVTTTPLWIKGWPKELDGVLIALIADLHVGRRRGKRWASPSLSKAVNAVSRAHPNLLVLCGDYGFWNWDAVETTGWAAQFAGAERVAILGNHDYAKGRRAAAKIRSELERHGVTVLVNEATSLQLRGRTVVIAGLDDASTKHDDMDRLVATLPEDNAPVILLSHTPDGVEKAPQGRFWLALSGHTHGGQVAIPFLRRRILKRFAKTNYDRGLYEVNGIPLFVTRGLGMVGFHVRFRSRPQVALLRLHSEP